MEENEELPDFPVAQPVAPEHLAAHVATPVVAVTQPVSSHSEQSLSRLEDNYNQLTLKLGEISGKLDAMTVKAPEPIAPSVQENEAGDSEHVAAGLKDASHDAVALTVDDSPIKPPKAQPQERNRRGLRKHR